MSEPSWPFVERPKGMTDEQIERRLERFMAMAAIGAPLVLIPDVVAGADPHLVAKAIDGLFAVQQCAMPDVVEAHKALNASMRAELDRLTTMPTNEQLAQMVAGQPAIVSPAGIRVVPFDDYFGDEGLTLAQKRHREQALNHGY